VGGEEGRAVRETPAGYPKWTVRPARPNDAARLGEFLLEAWKEAGPGALGFTGATEGAIKEIASEEFLSRRLSSPNVRMVVAEFGNRFLGFASLRTLGGGSAELSGIVVLQSAAGEGIGTRLLRKACDLAAKSGLAAVAVKTESFNRRAIGFYKKNGFVETGRTMEKVGKSKVPVQVLEKSLHRGHEGRPRRPR
jgi:ribosomal protein S18 acetylase RimI-like enzyme